MISVIIEDGSLEVGVRVAVSGGYTPDVLHDLQNRAAETYRLAIIEKIAVTTAAQVAAEGGTVE